MFMRPIIICTNARMPTLRYWFVILFLHREIRAAPAVLNEWSHNAPLQRNNVTDENERCAVEFFRDLSFSSESHDNASLFYAAGESVTYRCDAHGNTKWSLHLELYPKNHIVYPESTRKCQPNGTWLGPRPFCVNTDRNIRTNKIEMFPSKFPTRCLSSSERACSGVWKQTGVMHERCQSLVDSNKRSFASTFEDDIPADYYSFIYRFDYKTHFSFLTFTSETSMRLLHVSVYVKEKDVIPAFSNESWEFQRRFYDNWTNINPKKDQCAVIQLTAFTDEVKVVYSLIQRDSPHGRSAQANITFYRISDVTDSYRLNKSCPDPPIIPNTRRTAIVPGAESFRYDCLSGYAAVEPTGGHSGRSFSLNCLNGAWNPYPFPICPIQRKESEGPETSNRPKHGEPTKPITYAKRTEEVEILHNTKPHFSSVAPATKTVEASVFSEVDPMVIFYKLIIGLLAGSLITLTLFITNQKLRKRFLFWLSPMRHSSSNTSELQPENSTSLIVHSENFYNEHQRHVYDYPHMNGAALPRLDYSNQLMN